MNKPIIAIIPARGGSKGLSKKNIRLLAGKPLIQYTIHASVNTKQINHTIVSTDDDEIMGLVTTENVIAIKRPAQISGDESPTIDTIFHAVEECKKYRIKTEIIVLLQPTSPLRTSADIDAAIDIFLNHNCDSVISVVKVQHPPYWNMVIEDTYLQPLLNQVSFNNRRQDFPETYLPNGAIYIARLETLLRTSSFYTPLMKPYVMPAEKSIDIDTEYDLLLAEMILTKEKFSC